MNISHRKLLPRDLVLLLSISTSSLYFLPSGLPQIGDIFFLLFISSVLIKSLRKKFLIEGNEVLICWAALTAWVVIVSLSWVMLQADITMARPVAYYTFNFLVGASIIFEISNRGTNVIKIIRAGLCAGLIVSLIGIVVNFGESARAVGFFNNPNQLAYYSLATAASIFAIDRCNVKIDIITACSYISALIGVLTSASIAAIFGMSLLIGVAGLLQLRSKKSFIKAMSIGALSTLILLAIDIQSENAITNGLIARYDRSSEKIDSAYEERGFDRLVENPHYLILGAGEGGLGRFNETSHEVGELHSSLLTLFFSYGLPGILIFSALVFLILRGKYWPLWFVTAAVMIYQVTHMGLRFTSFWLFLVIIYFSNFKYEYKEDRKT